jgi:hypothetical protein
MDEPTTVITDALLGATCAVLGAHLFRRGLRWWAAVFLFTSAGAFVGAVWHGWQRQLSPAFADSAWLMVLVSLGLTAFALEAAALARLRASRGLTRVGFGLAGLQLLVYLAWIPGHRSYVWVAAGTGTAMLVALAVHVRCWRRTHDAGAGWITAGLLTSLVAACLQAGGVSFHEHFNHNDLYHVVQLVGMGVLFRGATLREP